MERDRSNCSLGIWSIRVDTCLCELIPSLVSDVDSYILHQVLCVIPVPIARWVLEGIAFGLSGWFLGANIYPILASVCLVSPHLIH